MQPLPRRLATLKAVLETEAEGHFPDLWNRNIYVGGSQAQLSSLTPMPTMPTVPIIQGPFLLLSATSV